ncbi:thiol:disulfide interchange protein DsbA/DsbL [Noviherbaspirillum cavernae]|uniref:Thiol:disulfide interchange protein n=1 Tax=Noviherbaspirillum cavernae TaxID=2320862 RepID=A0A418X4Y4_9BURK|nr:thiol:disulfide interchange protein DsbA/DsbL [Noviherbaspirillum cavernae]RJG07524.1 thiol:disulfide interchange protein DsbA/DsbL [Noviherbaspirillum cavernae]
MRFLQHALAALSLSLVAITAGASPASPQNGVDYRTLDKEQQTDSGKKIEVTEFFWYACPHCNAIEPSLVEWVKKQGDNIVFKRVPVAFRDSFVPQQKLFYTLEAMGKLDELHKKVFDTIHKERRQLDTDAAITEWIVKQGVDKQKFLDVYNSFGIQSKARRAAQLQTAYQVDGVPLIAIDGRYLTSPSIVGAGMKGASEDALHTGTLQVMDWLVARAAKDKGTEAPKKAK